MELLRSRVEAGKFGRRTAVVVMTGLFAWGVLGCDATDAELAGVIAGVGESDAGRDAGNDAGTDSGMDAGTDPGTDAGTVANCNRECPSGFRCIPAGTFQMGSESPESNADERPVHQVVITRDFCMMDAEVKQAQWLQAYLTNPSTFSGCADCPVDSVNWWEALHYANWLSARDGVSPCYADFIGCNGVAPGNDLECTGVTFVGLDCGGYRLPTEAEWEYAARAGTVADRYGDVGEIAWYSGNSDSKTHEAREKEPNAWGLYDMLGNVWEWTWDWKGDYSSGTVTDPTGPSGGAYRVFRGGSWNYDAWGVRAAHRDWGDPGRRYGGLGFRLARSMAGP